MENKVCRKCGVEKSLSSFAKAKRCKDGRTSKCKECFNKETSIKRAQLKEERRSYYDKEKETEFKICSKCLDTKLLGDFYFENTKRNCSSHCKVCFKSNVNVYREKNNEKIKAKKREHSKKKWEEGLWTKEQLEKRRRQTKKWREENPDHVKNYNKKYKTENRALCKQISVRRRLKLTNAQPEWLEESLLIEVYDKAGTKDHIDHIIPISHPNVCGLHVPWNLQVLSDRENLHKNNKFDGTYENESWRVTFSG